MYYYIKGKCAFLKKDSLVVEYLENAFLQDCYEAELIYSLITSEDDMLDHLFRARMEGVLKHKYLLVFN